MPIKKRTEKKTKTDEVRIPRPKKVCQFCEGKKEPTYTDSANLRRFLSDRSKIQPKLRTGTCSKHQRAVSREIKYARFLGLLPFITKAA
ncbi:30S ribosomal protein S18 [Candidatus Daviesbacteria bacterium]|nr:30S ribosomal protein S18 [Candidatus Daviesbacteria bacterium]